MIKILQVFYKRIICKIQLLYCMAIQLTQNSNYVQAASVYILVPCLMLQSPKLTHENVLQDSTYTPPTYYTGKRSSKINHSL